MKRYDLMFSSVSPFIVAVASLPGTLVAITLVPHCQINATATGFLVRYCK